MGQPDAYDPHSPQSTGSPEPPSGVLTDAEARLWELVLAIHSVQTRFNRPMANGTVNGANGTGTSGTAGHQQLLLAEPVQAILRKMSDVDDIAAQIGTQIPRQAVEDLDNTHHPGHVVKERIESVSLENAFLNGKIAAITGFRDILGDALADGFPELTHLRRSLPTASAHNPTTSREPSVPIKKEEP
ncbi:hypothetical protein M408DRAFT_330155 [Serendipita vermifera MAFF 305830]|uniref:Mediator of RNA polymerase II transcription subunit 10 n=1 Tax=Serendipita vermifera MAFF 305830 TaxID=933852 RepID=A0A0C3B4Y8_SERVB|nr:hypothetical protein M408DRAFT_330155 [Serendipita vermifera MAFF 305830]